MRFRLPTVRAKLTALVSLSVVVMLAALPVLSWLLHRQLVDEVDDRVTDAERAFQTELDDDLADLTLASRILSADGATRGAITAAGRRRRAPARPGVRRRLPEHRRAARPARRQGPRAGRLRHSARRRRWAWPRWRRSLKGTELKAVVDHGCESPTSKAPPAYVIGVPLPGVGAVFTCMPVDAGYLKNASSKLGLELALAVLGGGEKIVGRHAGVPQRRGEGRGPHRHDDRRRGRPVVGRAALRAAPARAGALGKVSMVAALDVTRHPPHRAPEPLLRAGDPRRRRPLVSVAFG